MSRKPNYRIGSQVQLKTDAEARQRIITKYEVSARQIMYCVAIGTDSSWHYDFEIEPYSGKAPVEIRR